MATVPPDATAPRPWSTLPVPFWKVAAREVLPPAVMGVWAAVKALMVGAATVATVTCRVVVSPTALVTVR